MIHCDSSPCLLRKGLHVGYFRTLVSLLAWYLSVLGLRFTFSYLSCSSQNHLHRSINAHSGLSQLRSPLPRWPLLVSSWQKLTSIVLVDASCRDKSNCEFPSSTEVSEKICSYTFSLLSPHFKFSSSLSFLNSFCIFGGVVLLCNDLSSFKFM